MAFLPDKCRVPKLLRERHIEPVDFYTDMGWTKQKYWEYVNHIKYMNSGTQKTVAHYFGLPMDDIYTYKWVPRKGERIKQSRT